MPIASTEPRCGGCRRPWRDARLCSDCVRELSRLLVGAPGREQGLAGLLEDLADAVARLDALAPAPKRPRIDGQALVAPAARWSDRRALVANPAPVNLAAVTVRDRVRAVLRAVIADVAAERGLQRRRHPVITEGPTCRPHVHGRGPADCQLPAERCGAPHHCRHQSCQTIRRQLQPDADRYAVAWLAVHVTEIAQCEKAGGMLRELRKARAVAERAVDRRSPDVYGGPCDAPDVKTWHDPQSGVVSVEVDRVCGADLWGNLGDDTFTCDSCGSVHPAEGRRDWLIDQVRNVWARPAEIARALTSLDIEVTPARLDKWISRDRAEFEAGRRRKVAYPPILPVSWTVLDDEGDPVLDEHGEPLGKPMFRIGDVMDRVDALRAGREQKETA